MYFPSSATWAFWIRNLQDVDEGKSIVYLKESYDLVDVEIGTTVLVLFLMISPIH